MPDGARTVVDIIVGDYNLPARIIKFGKGPKLTLISLFFGYRIGNLDIVLFVTLISHKIDFMSSVIILGTCLRLVMTLGRGCYSLDGKNEKTILLKLR